MSKVVTSKTVNIFLALDQKSLAGYFNPHDTSPLYKRQLSLRFEQYIHNSLKSCKRYRNANKKLHLKHLSQDCRTLLKNAENIIEVNIIEDPEYHVAVERG